MLVALPPGRAIPPYDLPAEVHVLSSGAAEEEPLLRLLRADCAAAGASVLGLDTESRPPPLGCSDRNPIALVQLSSRARCVLLRVAIARVSDALRALLQDASILKARAAACRCGPPRAARIRSFRPDTSAPRARALGRHRWASDCRRTPST